MKGVPPLTVLEQRGREFSGLTEGVKRDIREVVEKDSKRVRRVTPRFQASLGVHLPGAEGSHEVMVHKSDRARDFFKKLNVQPHGIGQSYAATLEDAQYDLWVSGANLTPRTINALKAKPLQLRRPGSEWRDCQLSELEGWRERGVYRKVSLSEKLKLCREGAQVMSTTWVCTPETKDKPQKARLVLQGTKQTVSQTNSPTASSEALNVLMSVVAQRGDNLTLSDISKAFLNAPRVANDKSVVIIQAQLVKGHGVFDAEVPGSEQPEFWVIC